MTPNFAVIGMQTPYWHTPRLWIPLFLLWIPIVLLSPILFLLLVALAIAARTNIWRIIALAWGVVTALPGTDVRVHSENNNVVVRIL